MLAVGTSRVACAAACAAVATLLVATVYCLLNVCEYSVLLLAIHVPERLAAACCLLWSFLTKYKMSHES